MRASVTIHVETLWTNRAELLLEAEFDNPRSETNQQVVSMMFEAGRLMAGEDASDRDQATAERQHAQAPASASATRALRASTIERAEGTGPESQDARSGTDDFRAAGRFVAARRDDPGAPAQRVATIARVQNDS
jgi:hypothetical protein